MPLIKASLLKWRRLTERFAVEHGAHGGSMMTGQNPFRLQILQSTLLLLFSPVERERVKTNESSETFIGASGKDGPINMSRHCRFQRVQIVEPDWQAPTHPLL